MLRTSVRVLCRSLAFAGMLLAVPLTTPSTISAWTPAPEYRSRQLQIQRQVDLSREIQRLRANQMSRDLKTQMRGLKEEQGRRRLELELWKSRQTKTTPTLPPPLPVPETPAQPSSTDKGRKDKGERSDLIESQHSVNGLSVPSARTAPTGEPKQ